MEDELCQEPCTFEELDLSDYDSDMDADYSPSEESSSEDDLEFCTDAAESTEAEMSASEEDWIHMIWMLYIGTQGPFTLIKHPFYA